VRFAKPAQYKTALGVVFLGGRFPLLLLPELSGGGIEGNQKKGKND
jgi:hypothetical protein